MKKRFFNYLLLLLIPAIIGLGCKKFDDININPNATTVVTSGMLATSMILSITKNDISSQKTFMQAFMLDKYIIWSEDNEDFQYNNFGRASFSNLITLNNIPEMIGYASNDASKSSYTALGHFIKAWQFFKLTMYVGDVPFSEALQGESSGNIKPKYDAQRDVFAGIINELDSANMLFAAGSDFNGDPIYNGSVDQWQRLTNSFELRVLINLYKKTDDAGLNVINKFKDVANRPLMRDYTDNFALTYADIVNQQYPWYNIGGSNPFVIYPMVSSTIIDPLKAMKDRRLFYYAKPSDVQLSNGKKQSDYDAYIGTEPSTIYSEITDIHSGGDFSDVNNRYADLANCEPVNLFSYSELQFILAEASLRGWVTGVAENYYESGITNSMQFLAKYTPANSDYTHDMPITDAYIQSYLPTVKLTGSFDQQLAQVITQKYIAAYMQDPDYTSWFDQRRTGIPAFIINPGSNENLPSTKLPVRWLYPQSELDYNGINVTAAIASQYGGSDNTNGIMWLLK